MHLKRHLAAVFISSALAVSQAVAAPIKPEAVPMVPSNFTELAKKVSPAVVNISTARGNSLGKRLQFPRRPKGQHDEWEEFFEKFFENAPNAPKGKLRSLGSGFIISADGLIVTNNHVVGNADDIKVQLADKRQFDAKLIGVDPKTDMALIRINAKEPLPYLSMGNSDEIDIGQWVVAIGNPFGLGNTVTAGIVSAKGRIIHLGPYDDFIQTDASINPGNSGGPLFNMAGEVVGINTAIVASGQGIGFAIPVNLAKEIIPQLQKGGKVVRGWLGVLIQSVSPELASGFDLAKAEGALVSQVLEKSPAEKAGIQQGDIITKFDGRKIDEMTDLPRLVANTPVGKRVDVDIVRKGKKQTVVVLIEQLKEEDADPVAKNKAEPEEKHELGMVLQEINPDLAKRFELKEKKGLLVADVRDDSPALEAGVQKGDVITEVNQERVASVSEFKKAIKKKSDKNLVVVLVKREGAAHYLTIKPQG